VTFGSWSATYLRPPFDLSPNAEERTEVEDAIGWAYAGRLVSEPLVA
jgi:hypothetical protein